jgi:hypothetical protein
MLSMYNSINLFKETWVIIHVKYLFAVLAMSHDDDQ